jgi:choline-sulfatase
VSKRPNILILMSDEHARRVMGTYGDPIVKTPHLDQLAKGSIVFDAAYTPSPICVPARAALATGKDIHEIGCWDNAHPYEGTPESWAHILRDKGFTVESIGKLHYRDELKDTGFSKQHIPMHVADGIGDLTGSFRSPPPHRKGSRTLAENLGAGETSYTHYDRAVRDAAIARLDRAAAANEHGLVLLVSFVAPHFPLIAPEHFFDLYANTPMAPRDARPTDAAQHPWLKALRASYDYDNFDETRREIALRSYYGLVSFLDDNIGQVLRALAETGRSETTSVIYMSDHGDNLGERGMWGKSTFFEESCGVPLIVRQAGKTNSQRCKTPVSLTDVFPTILDLAGHPEPAQLHRRSLLQIAKQPNDPDRVALSQYHAAGSPSAAYMLRQHHWKYVHYEQFDPQLFDLGADPFERENLAGLPSQRLRVGEFERLLSARLDPKKTDQKARKAQHELLAAFGGANAVLQRGSKFIATPAPREH